jgi:mono/diheme cytochrome c family protein
MTKTMKSRAHSLCWIGAIAVTAGLAASAAAQRRAGPYAYESGQDIYEHICQGCHMPDAKGAAGAGMYPALAGNPKLKAALYPVLVILRGQKAMPSFSELSDAQVAAVTNYIRSHYGNSGPGEVTVDQVKDLRSKAVSQNALRPG